MLLTYYDIIVKLSKLLKHTNKCIAVYMQTYDFFTVIQSRQVNDTYFVNTRLVITMSIMSTITTGSQCGDMQ